MSKFYDRESLAPLVGRRFAGARSASNVSLKALAERTGFTEEELHAFERGSDMFPAGRILSLAETLGRPLADFFPPDLHSSDIGDFEDELKGLIISELLKTPSIVRLIQTLDMLRAGPGSIEGSDP